MPRISILPLEMRAGKRRQDFLAGPAGAHRDRPLPEIHDTVICASWIRDKQGCSAWGTDTHVECRCEGPVSRARPEVMQWAMLPGTLFDSGARRPMGNGISQRPVSPDNQAKPTESRWTRQGTRAGHWAREKRSSRIVPSLPRHGGSTFRRGRMADARA
jgi:hypothetical protein